MTQQPQHPARLERVVTDAGWHGRLVGGNNETVWITPAPLNTARAVIEALEFTAGLLFGWTSRVIGPTYDAIPEGLPTKRKVGEIQINGHVIPFVDIDDRGESEAL